MVLLVALLAGALLGLALGTVGGGGAVLAVPVLVYGLDQSVHAATTESLLIVVGAAAIGAIGHARRGAICWRLAAAFAGAAVAGSLAGTAANRAVTGPVLLGAFGLLLLAVAALTWRRATATNAATDGGCPPLRPAIVLAAGLATGTLTGIFGVGGGFIVLPILAIALHVPLRKAIGTSLAIVAAVSVAGLLEHVLAGASVSWMIVLPFAAAAMLAAAFGGTLAARLPRAALARAFALLLTGVAIYLLLSVTAFGGPPQG